MVGGPPSPVLALRMPYSLSISSLISCTFASNAEIARFLLLPAWCAASTSLTALYSASCSCCRPYFRASC